MQGVFDGPVAAVDAQQPLGIAVCGVWLVTPQEVSTEVSVTRPEAAGAANEEGLPDAGEQAIVVERGGGPDFALFPASVRGRHLPLMGLPVVWAKSGGRFASSWNHAGCR